jgi:hypothetical protein
MNPSIGAPLTPAEIERQRLEQEALAGLSTTKKTKKKRP